MTVISIGRTELSRLRAMIELADGRTRVEDAAALMGLRRRQVYRLLDEFRAQGSDALISKRRGKPGNGAHGAFLRQTCVAIVRERYEDFAPTLAAEKPREVHGIPSAARHCACGCSTPASGPTARSAADGSNLDRGTWRN